MRQKYKPTNNGMLLFKKKKYVSDVVGLKKLIMDEFQK